MLPLQLRGGRTAACDACGARCQGTLHGPRQLLGEEGAWRWAETGPYCRRCQRRIWAAYVEVRRERMALVRLSLRLGYAARRADLDRERAGDEGRQQALFARATQTR